MSLEPQARERELYPETDAQRFGKISQLFRDSVSLAMRWDSRNTTSQGCLSHFPGLFEHR